MDLAQLKNTSDEQFKKDISFNAEMPDGTETDLVLTVKSARNPDIKGKLAKLIGDLDKERVKLDRPNVSAEQYDKTAIKISELDKEIAKLVLVKFSGLTDGDKPYPCNKDTLAKLVDEHSWIRDAIVKKSTNEDAFYAV